MTTVTLDLTESIHWTEGTVLFGNDHDPVGPFVLTVPIGTWQSLGSPMQVEVTISGYALAAG